ncbi:MAG: helix-turn-helix domain-containing protein [Deltaproteobacteria bacterium]
MSTWDIATRRPTRSPVRRLLGYDERTPGPLCRRELPGPKVVCIIELGPPLGVFEHGRPEPSRFRGGFVAGVDDRSTLTAHDGWQRGIQIDLSPMAVRDLFGVAMHELTRTIVDLDALLPAKLRSLPEELQGLPSWEARFDRVERWLAGRLSVRAADPRVVCALACIEDTGGNVDVAALCGQLGVSRAHLARLFREHVGVTPKLYARLVRFDRLTTRLAGGTEALAPLAADLGYYDQAHLARDVRAFAQMTPTELGAHVAGGPLAM